MPKLAPLQVYKQKIQSGELERDEAQVIALQSLNRIYMELTATDQARKHWLFKRKKLKSVKGLYMYGGVGRGKTVLMDIFYGCLPGDKKLRLHFYRFMAMVHEQLRALEHEANPLVAVAKSIAKDAKVICFDEFIVEDIADAMILGLLFKSLFNEGVTLVTTSNIQPDGLYEGGLQRDRFLPAIDLLKRHCEILNVDSGNDYRVEDQNTYARYYTPLEGEADFMQAQFDQLSDQSALFPTHFEILERSVECIARTDAVIWFDFKQICTAPRSADDYIEVANRFKFVLLSNVPQFYDSLNDQARRFIALVDELYDNNIRLVISAQVPIFELYAGSQLAAAFERTKSRLVEMQRV